VNLKSNENSEVDGDSSGVSGGCFALSRSFTPLASEWRTVFVPRRGLADGHLQTIVGNFYPRPPFLLATEAEIVEVDPANGSRVLCHCHWQPEAVRAQRLTVILVHGLEGSSNSRYILGVTARA
jgi:predicted alpha/beta-fold hydrolase